eukprot:PITA_34151
MIATTNKNIHCSYLGARRIAEEGLREEIRILIVHLEVVKAGSRRDPEVGDDIEEEAEATIYGSNGETPEVRLLRFVLVASNKSKPELLNYDDSLSIEVLLDWINKLDKYFECEEVSEDRKVKFATTNLKGHAALWWDSVQAEKRRLNKLPIKTWSRMVAMLKGKFLPKDYQISLHRQVQNLKQKVMTVREYIEEFYRVNLRVGYTEDTIEKTTRYVNGLRLEILDEICIMYPKNIEEAYQSAMKAEEKITRRQNARRGRGAGRGKGQSYGRGKTSSSNEEGSSSRASRSVDKGDSVRGGRPYQRGRGNGRGRGVGYQCYRCHKWRHRSFECLEVVQAGQRDAYVPQLEEAEAPPEEAKNAPDTREALVLNKVLLKPANEAIEQTHRKDLFRTVCKSHGKCCKLIIDSGSIDNLVSIVMVKKLELTRLKHPTPYKVSWLQKGHQLLVDEQCEVEFQIGRYKDKVICDITLMDVCHKLLGRPWQYDRKVVYDGLTNCYKFFKDGIKHMLVPIKQEGTKGTSEPRALLIGGKQFLKQVEDNRMGYAIVKREKIVFLHIEALDLPPKIHQMLQEFTDIVADDLPNKLPPKRRISHHIDFILGAGLANKAAYRMSPKENEDIRKQV